MKKRVIMRGDAQKPCTPVGVKSLGLMTNTAGLPDGGTELRGFVVFGNDADAKRAVETVASFSRDAKTPRERPMWRALHPVENADS